VALSCFLAFSPFPPWPAPVPQCGCRCLSCCADEEDPATCRAPTEGDPCTLPNVCVERDETDCGLQYSDGDNAFFCEVTSPSIWPALMQVPKPEFFAKEWAPNMALVYTGDNPVTAKELAVRMFPDPSTTPQQTAAATAFGLEGASNVRRNGSTESMLEF
jgi:hypothetical protein